MSVSGLRKRYGGRDVVSEVGLSVQHGECFALLGPNGAGKTTTVEILEGYRHRDAGEVSVLGEDPAKAGRDWRARIGIVLQNTQDNAELTVAETVTLFADYYPSRSDPDEVIEIVGLGEQRDKRTRHLSGGQRRRLDVALGIVGRPELLFLDEPTTGFDPEARQIFWTLIERLKAAGTTILLTTHYLEEAERLADRVAVIAAGKLLVCGPPESIGDRSQATVSWIDGLGHARSVQTTTPTAVIRGLLEASPNGEIDGLSIVRPSLEDAYLALIGGATEEEAR